MRLSIIIASYNRSESLGRFLDQIGNQEVPVGVDWECIIVDNNSTDSTHAVVAAFEKRSPERFRYLLESRQGKSAALNRGILEATGEILVFTDDDCVPRCDWLASIAREFASHSSLAATGGRVELYNERDKPLSIRTCTERKRISSPSELFSLLIGCNMAIHRRVFDVVREFDTFLGPGYKTKALEDLDFLYRIYERGFEMVYSPAIFVYHNHGRRSEAEVQSLRRNYLIGRGAFYCKYILRGDRQISKMAYWEVSSLTRGFFRQLLKGHTFQEQGQLLWALLIGAGYRLAWNCRLQRT